MLINALIRNERQGQTPGKNIEDEYEYTFSNGLTASLLIGRDRVLCLRGTRRRRDICSAGDSLRRAFLDRLV